MKKWIIRIVVAFLFLLLSPFAQAQEKTTTSLEPTRNIHSIEGHICYLHRAPKEILFVKIPAIRIRNEQQNFSRIHTESIFPAATNERSRRMFDGWPGRIEDVLRNKRLLRYEWNSFRIDIGYERQWRYGDFQRNHHVATSLANSGRMGIRFKWGLRQTTSEGEK